MRKLLLSILSLFAFALVANAAEIVFDMSDPNAYVAESNKVTYATTASTAVKYASGTVFTNAPITITTTSTDANNGIAAFTQSEKKNKAIQIRGYVDSKLVFKTTDGSVITKIAISGSSINTTYLKADVGAIANSAWTGSSNKVEISIIKSTIQINTITVATASADAITAPTFSVAEGTYYEAQTVTITNPNSSGKVYYTTNGDDPTAESTEYTRPIEITATTTLKAVVVDGDKSSEITSATYTITTMPEVDNIAAFKKLGKGGIAKITCPLTVAAVYTNKSNYVNYYVQDEAGDGIVIYGAVADLPEYAKTAIIPAGFIGTYAEFNGLPEIVDCEGLAEATETGTIVAAGCGVEDLATDQICKVVELSGAEILDISGSNFNIKDETGTVAAYNKFSLKRIEAYTGLKIVGIVDVYNGKIQILPIEIDYSNGTAEEAEINTDDDIVVSTGDGSIIVDGGDVIQIVTPDGRATTVKGSGDTPDRRRRIIETENGIYIVVVDGEVVEKVYVE